MDASGSLTPDKKNGKLEEVPNTHSPQLVGIALTILWNAKEGWGRGWGIGRWGVGWWGRGWGVVDVSKTHLC